MLFPMMEALTRDVCTLVRSCSKHRYSEMVSNVVDYIHANYFKEITPGGIAQYFGMNASYLSSRFRRETEYTISGYINHVRLQYASEMLMLSNMAICDIAVRAGIPDQRISRECSKKLLASHRRSIVVK